MGNSHISSGILVFLTCIALVLICGCCSSSTAHSSASSSPPAPVSPTVTVLSIETAVIKDFDTIALTINDLPHGWIKSSGPTSTDNTYETSFANAGATYGVSLTFSIDRYASIDEAKNEFLSRKDEITNLRVDALNIGNEGFGYQGPSITSVVFRNSNLIVTLTSNTYPAYSISSLQPYAKIVDRRINA